MENMTQTRTQIEQILEQFFEELDEGKEVGQMKEYKISEDLTEDQFVEILEWLKREGFYNSNGSRNTIAEFIDYKAYDRIEIFECIDNEKIKIILDFEEIINNKGKTYYIESISLGLENNED